MRSFKYIWLCILLFWVISLPAKNIVVSPGGVIRTIASAINLAEDGDVIILSTGTYTETDIRITKSITLRSDEHAIIDGALQGHLVVVLADGVTISGITFRNTGYSSLDDRAGVKAIQVRDMRLENCRFENCCFAVYLDHSVHCFVLQNKVVASGEYEHDTGNGIQLFKCDSCVIQENEITGQRDGIYFEFVSNTAVRNNKAHENIRYGLHFMFSNMNVYTDNIFTNNRAGVAVMYSNGVTMTGNIFSECVGGISYGLLLKEINDCKIASNHFVHNTVALYIEGSNRLLIEKNEIRGNGWACKIQASCAQVQMRYNNFILNTFDVSTNGSLNMNRFSDNYWDRYEGYDMDKDGIGDVPFVPVSLYGVIVEKVPYAIMLYRSFMVYLLDRSEKLVPSVTPETLKDFYPHMKPYAL